MRVFTARDLAAPESLEALAGELERDDFAVVLCDVDALDDDTLTEIVASLQGREESGWVGMTVGDSGAGSSTVGAMLLPFCTHTVQVPPLRYRIEDLDELVPLLLRQLTRGRDVSVSAEAMRQLSKYPRPGNVSELRHVLREMVTNKRSGVIDVAQLPPAVRALARHRLSRIQALERDAIIRALEENDHHKPAAAVALGISRATIYRKIKEFGIDV